MVKGYTLLVIALGLSNLMFSQNLVPNPSFECGTDPCLPTIYIADFRTYACGWSCPTEGTSDIFSTLISDKGCYSSVPYHGTDAYNHIGSQSPRTGNRFTGMYTYSAKYPLREYIQVKLKNTLIPGEYYCAEMYVSLAEFRNFSCNNLGMYFSDNETVTHNVFGPLPYTPQIVDKNVINDTASWVRISGTFKATSPAKYLVIGNFNTDIETTLAVRVPYLGDYYDYAYYFIDDVSIEHLPQKNFFYSGRTEICQGESTMLKISGYENVTWSTLTDTLTILSNADTLRVKPQVTTQYVIKVRNCNLIVKDTITVKVLTFLQVNLGKDTTLCQGSSIKLNAGTLLGSVYNWQDNSSDQYLTVNQAGKYFVSVSNPFNNCIGYDDINIAIKTIPKIDLGSDTLICKDFYPLKAGEGGATQYQWSTGSTDSVFTPAKSGKYWVTVENRCGQSRDSIRIYSASDIFLPNVLTLNGDKLNEEFKVALIDDTAQNLRNEFALPGKLIIYNRWGNELFSDNKYITGWPPANRDLEQGIYYYTFNYLNCPTYKGWIHVLK